MRLAFHFTRLLSLREHTREKLFGGAESLDGALASPALGRGALSLALARMSRRIAAVCRRNLGKVKRRCVTSCFICNLFFRGLVDPSDQLEELNSEEVRIGGGWLEKRKLLGRSQRFGIGQCGFRGFVTTKRPLPG